LRTGEQGRGFVVAVASSIETTDGSKRIARDPWCHVHATRDKKPALNGNGTPHPWRR